MKIERTEARHLFRTPMFRESAFIQSLCNEVGTIFATHDASRPGHFTTYFRVFTIRPQSVYPNPVIADLYALHELWHLKFQHLSADVGWLEWVRRRCDSEFQASVTSECLIYFHIPALRAVSFPHEIWMDRFATPTSGTLAAREAEVASERRRAQSAPHADDFIEFQLHNYARQNMQWCRIWGEPVGYGVYAESPAFRVVEQHLATPGWADRHAEWVDSVSLDGVPFLRQADAFRAVYDETNRLWGNQYFRR